ncbi:MAG: response regulator transcription factor [Spirochaetales bacterium]|nr:response regulator transcription factor [Spirochaetales bacterium]
MIKVIIADDHAIIRRGIREILDETDSIRVIDEAADGKELIAELAAKRCDVVLLDINMPGKTGLDVLRDIQSVRPGQKVLMLSIYPEEEYAIRAIKSGAAGYLKKDSHPRDIVDAIKTVSSGRKYFSKELYDDIVEELRNPEPDAPHKRLSNREMEIFTHIGGGKTLSEIAEALCLSPKTVSTYRARILEKTKMKNNAEIMKYVIENKLE